MMTIRERELLCYDIIDKQEDVDLINKAIQAFARRKLNPDFCFNPINTVTPRQQMDAHIKWECENIFHCDPDDTWEGGKDFTCCLCGRHIKHEFSNNAEPLKKGRCCMVCNQFFVLGARTMMSRQAYKELHTSEKLEILEALSEALPGLTEKDRLKAVSK